MNKHAFTIAAAAVLLAGCVSTSPGFDGRFGDSVRNTMASQVADPAASANTNPVLGLDGRAAQAVQRRYEASFHAPAKHDAAMTTGSAK